MEGGWEAAAPVGESRDWVVLSIEPQRRRLSVAPAPVPGQLAVDAPITSGSTVKGKVQKVERFGVFVWLAPGKVGLLPNALTGVPRGTPVSIRFRTGQEIEVEVLEVADEGRRIRLGVPGVIAEEPPPRRERDRDRDRERGRDRDRGRREEMPTQVSSSGGSFGTSLGDVHRAAMEKKSS